MFNTLHFLGNFDTGLKACLTHNMHSLKCEQVNMSFYERMQILSRSELFVDFTLVYHIIFDERRDRKCFLFVNLALKHVKRNKTSNFALKYIKAFVASSFTSLVSGVARGPPSGAFRPP